MRPLILALTLTGVATSLLHAQTPDTSRFKKLHEKNSVDRCLGVMRAQPHLYAYLCQDEAKRRVIRFSKDPLTRPGGKHPEESPEIPDMELDLYGFTLSKEAIDFLEPYVKEHNKQVPTVLKEQAEASVPKPPTFKSLPELLEIVDLHKQEKEKAVADMAAVPKRDATSSREEYLQLAGQLSFDHRLSGREVDPVAVPENLERLKGSGATQVQHAAQLLLLGLNSEKELRGSGARTAEASARNAEEVRQAAERGEYTEKVEYYDYDDRGNLRKNEYEIDRSFLPTLLSGLAAGMAAENAPEMEKIQRRLALDGARIRAWDELLPEVAERHAGPLTQRQLVQIDYLNDGPGGQPLPAARTPQMPFAPNAADTFRGRYVATNLAPRDLHNVTLAIDMYHYSTLPVVTLRHVYFLPVWKKGETLEFSRSFFGDMKRGAKFYSVPAGEDLGGGRPGVNPELEGLAGMVRMQSTLWSDEARQVAKTHEFPQRAKAISQVCIKYAERSASASWAVSHPDAAKWRPAFGRPKIPEAPQATPEERTQLTLAHHLKPVFDIMPADSPEVSYAKRLLTDFREVRDQIFDQRATPLVAACAEGKRYIGTWDAPGVTGELGLLFVFCEPSGKWIRGELFYPNQPELRRLVTGYVFNQRYAAEAMIMLEPINKDQGVELSSRAANGPNFHILDQSVKSYRFRLKDGRLVGDASTHDLQARIPYDGSVKVMSLAEVSRDAAELAAAKERDEAAPKVQPQIPSETEAPTRQDRTQSPRATMKNRPGTATTPSAPKMPAATAPSRAPSSTAPSKSPLAGNSPLGGNSPPGSLPGSNPLFGNSPLGGAAGADPATEESNKKRKLTPAEARAKAQTESLALQALNNGKQAIARKDTNLAKAYLQQAMKLAPDSPAAKQAEKLLKGLEKKG